MFFADITNYIAFMVDIAAHPLILDEPGAAIWKRSDQPGHAFRPQRHAELVVLLATAGQASYFIDGNILELTSGTLLWALAGQAHFLMQDSSDFDMWVLLISDRVLTSELRKSPQFPPLTEDDRGGAQFARVLSGADLDALSRLAGLVKETADPEAQRIGFQWWMTRAWTAWQNASTGKRRAVHPAVDQAVLSIETDVTKSWEEVCKPIPLSPGRLARLFKQQTGQSPLEFRNERRLQRVDDLMNLTNPPDLLTACLDVGFGSYSQFFRVFRDLRNKSPRSYYAPGATRFCQKM